MYPVIHIQVVADVSEMRSYTDRQNGNTRNYRVRNVSGICSSFGAPALVTAQVPERVAFEELAPGSEVDLLCSKFEVGRGIWQVVVAGVRRVAD